MHVFSQDRAMTKFFALSLLLTGALFCASSAFASASGVDTPSGVHTLPLSVEGQPIVTLNDNPQGAIMNGYLGLASVGSLGTGCSVAGAMAYDAGNDIIVYCSSRTATWSSIASKPSVTVSDYQYNDPDTPGGTYDLGVHDYCALDSHWWTSTATNSGNGEQRVVPGAASGSKRNWSMANAWQGGGAICFDFN
jgi:hypothetical protein